MANSASPVHLTRLAHSANLVNLDDQANSVILDKSVNLVSSAILDNFVNLVSLANPDNFASQASLAGTGSSVYRLSRASRSGILGVFLWGILGRLDLAWTTLSCNNMMEIIIKIRLPMETMDGITT